MGADALIFLQENLRPIGNGVEIAGLRRAAVFAEILKVPVTIYTSNFSPRLREHEGHLRRSGTLAPGVTLLNLYEGLVAEFTSGHLSALEPIECDGPPVSTVTMPLASGKTLIRRTYAKSSVNHLPGCDLFEAFDYEGKTILCKGYKSTSATPLKVTAIALSDHANTVQHYLSESEFVCDALCRQLDRSQRWHMLVDKNFMYRCVRNSLARFGLEATLSSVVHSTHLRRDKRLKTSYAHWLNHPDTLDAIVVHTDGQRSALACLHGLDDKLMQIPHTLPQWPASPKRNLTARPTVLYAARYEREKRHQLLFEAFALVLHKVPEAELHTYGSGSEHASLVDWVNDHHLTDRIHVHPPTTRVGELCDQAWCGVLTSVEESFSLFTLECLAHGCPVVAFDIDYGPRELLYGGQGGTLVPDGDVTALAAALVDLLSQPAQVLAKSQDAREAAQRYAPEKVAASWALWHEKMLAIGRARYGG